MKFKLILAMVFVISLIVTLFFRQNNDSHSNEKLSVKRSQNAKKNYAGVNSQDFNKVLKQDKVAKENKIKEELDRFDQEAEEFEDAFGRIDKMWSSAVQYEFKKLGVSQNAFEEYQQMRQEFEQEALTSLEKFHQDMEAEKGKDYTYRITEFDDKVMNSLRKKYHDRLAKLIGDEATKEFIKLRDEFNEKLMRDHQGVEDDFTIDF